MFCGSVWVEARRETSRSWDGIADGVYAFSTTAPEFRPFRQVLRRGGRGWKALRLIGLNDGLFMARAKKVLTLSGPRSRGGEGMSRFKMG